MTNPIILNLKLEVISKIAAKINIVLSNNHKGAFKKPIIAIEIE